MHILGSFSIKCEEKKEEDRHKQGTNVPAGQALANLPGVPKVVIANVPASIVGKKWDPGILDVGRFSAKIIGKLRQD